MNEQYFRPCRGRSNNLRVDSNDPPRWPAGREGNVMLLACVYVRYQTEQLKIVATRMLEQHRRRASMGATTTLDAPSVDLLEIYIKKLSAVEDQPGFPHHVEWPEVPVCLSHHVIT